VRGVGERVEHVVESGNAVAISRWAVPFAAYIVRIGDAWLALPDAGYRQPVCLGVAKVVEVVDHRLAGREHVAQADLDRLDARRHPPVFVRWQPVGPPADRELSYQPA
jgi:hypothetical protein